MLEMRFELVDQNRWEFYTCGSRSTFIPSPHPALLGVKLQISCFLNYDVNQIFLYRYFNNCLSGMRMF